MRLVKHAKQSHRSQALHPPAPIRKVDAQVWSTRPQSGVPPLQADTTAMYALAWETPEGKLGDSAAAGGDSPSSLHSMGGSAHEGGVWE